MSEKFQLGHARIDRVDRQGALAAIVAAVRQEKPCYVVTPNSDHLVMLEDDETLRRIYQDAFLVVADGMPLVWASRLLGQSLPERVTGSELMPELCALAASQGFKIFLLGAGPGVAEEAKRRLEIQYPGLRIVGVYCPPMGFEKNPEVGEEIERLLTTSAPDIIFVGLGAPKQEKWIHQNYKRFAKGVFLGIGASIDFAAGNVKRAPVWMQKSGTEWVYRLLQEPKRLAKRYAKDTYVLWIIARQFFRR